MEKEKRLLGLDILKIGCMLMVVCLHSIIYGVGDLNEGWERFFLYFVNAFCIVAVNCFVLITGYFVSDSESRNQLKKIRTLWIQVFMYSVGGYIVAALLTKSFSMAEVIKAVFPYLTDQYWFFTCYILLLAFSPYLNLLINNMDQKTYKQLITIALLLFSVVLSVDIFADWNAFGTRYGYSLLWFMILYIIAAYIKRYSVPQLPFGRLYIGISVVLGILQSVVTLVSSLDIPIVRLLSIVVNLQMKYTSVPVVISSLCLFTKALNSYKRFGNKKIEYIITKLAKLSFGVYLFHESCYLRNIIWEKIDLPCAIIQGNFVSRWILAIFVIFMTGIVIELARNVIINIIMRVRK